MNAKFTYLVVRCHIVGNAEHFDVCRHVGDEFATLRQAQRWGLRTYDHDDFNIAVIHTDRSGKRWLKAWMWMDEVIDEAPEELHSIAFDLGVRLPLLTTKETP